MLTLGFILGFIRSPISLMGSQTIHLTPQETSWVIPWGNGRDTETVWAYTADFPNPEIRLKKGEPVRVVLRNRLKEPTTVHWHGMLVENTMDGVPGLTQDAVQPGEEFVYEFTPNVAGSFMYPPPIREPTNRWGAASSGHSSLKMKTILPWTVIQPFSSTTGA